MDISLHPEQVLKFKQWYDAVWLGDEEHGQTIPQIFSDERYAEYMDGYTLALGAWLESARQTANLNLLEARLLDAYEPEREGLRERVQQPTRDVNSRVTELETRLGRWGGFR